MVVPDMLINERYRVIRLLQQGGMGQVYAAYDQRLQRQVALKLVRGDVAADAATHQRFVREAQVAAQLTHPNVVRTYDVGDGPYGPYLVQELLDGRTLSQHLPLPPQHALRVALAVADALHHLHARGYVHGDIKPANIMLVPHDGRERVVLLDFGLARAHGTDTTTLLATPHYLAPERAQGAPPTPAADLYALGIVCYVMLTGRMPFDASTVPAIMAQHLHAPLPALGVAGPHGWQWEAIVRKLAAKQPENRYPSAAALRTDLHAALDRMAHTRPLAPPPAAPSAALPPRRRSRWIALFIGMVALVSLVLGLLTARGLRTTAPSAAQVSQTITAVPSTALVPNVVGLPLEDALAQLQQAGFIVVTDTTVLSDQTAGTVASVDPQPGQALAPGSQVMVQLSNGAANTTTGAGIELGAPSTASSALALTATPLPSASVADPTNTAAPSTATPPVVPTFPETPTLVTTPTASTAAIAGAPAPGEETTAVSPTNISTITATTGVTSTASAPVTIVTTLSDGARRFEHTGDGFAITLPAGWDAIDPAAPQLTAPVHTKRLGGADRQSPNAAASGRTFFALDVAPTAGITPGTNVNLLPTVTTPAPLDQFIDDLVVQLQNSQVVDGAIAQRRVTVGNGDAVELRYRVRQVDASGPAITTTQYIFDQDRRNYALTFSARQEHANAYAPVFEQIAQSFTVTP